MRVALVSPYSWTYPGGVTRHIEALATELLAQFNPAKPTLDASIRALQLIAEDIAPRLGWLKAAEHQQRDGQLTGVGAA